MDNCLREASAKVGENLRVEKQFFSRQNQVFLVNSKGDRRVLKRFVHGDQQQELELLQAAAKLNLPAPRLLVSGTGWLLMTYLEGTLLSDLLEEQGSENWSATFGAFLADCHQKTVGSDGLVTDLCDLNPRNFLRTTSGFYLLDLAAVEREKPARGLGRLFAGMLLFQPIFDARKCALTYSIWHAYENQSQCLLDRVVLQAGLRETALMICRRRPAKFVNLDVEALLDRWASQG